MAALAWILLSTFLVSLISLLGVFALMLSDKLLDELLIILVALSAGVLMGAAFFDLIPEAAVNTPISEIGVYVLAGFCLFFFVEKALHWRHCHDGKCHVHTFTYMNLIGNSIHNFIDGMIIAAGFVTSTSLGIVTSLSVVLHEIPHEIGDFGVLVFGKMKKTRALFLNFITALIAIAGGLVGYFVSSRISSFTQILLPVAAGGFIYIAATDLMPELKNEVRIKKMAWMFGIFLFGIAAMYFMSILLEGA
jgi:zinc and cadmium transporter